MNEQEKKNHHNMRFVESHEVTEFEEVFSLSVPSKTFFGRLLGLKTLIALDKPKYSVNALIKVDRYVSLHSIWLDHLGNEWQAFSKTTLFNREKILDKFEVPKKIYLKK